MQRTRSRRQMLSQALAGVGVLGLARTAASVPEARAREAELRSLLDRNHGRSPDFGGGFSNHVSMGLYSLAALGGNGALYDRFVQSEWAKLEPWPDDPGPALTPQTWAARLGRHDALLGYRAYFANELARLGRNRALRTYLPGLMPGVGAAAFHALIRTGYGVRFGDDREVVDGLAYWASAYLALGSAASASPPRSAGRVLAQLSEERALRELSLPDGPINRQLKLVSEQPAFAALLGPLDRNTPALPQIAAAAVQLYLTHPSFTALHAVTGTHAYRLLTPFIDPDSASIDFYFRAFAAAYVSVGAPPLRASGPASAAPPWSSIVPRALASLDAHDLKLCDVAREEEKFYAEPAYRRAAALRMRLS